ncbi:MAG: tRNA (adenosine(37)-N6)-dimethylallyltransferase [Gaiellaceae bacterium]
MAGRPSLPTRPSTTVLALFGPTGSGKSAVAEALADRIPAELVSADAMQAYRGLPILTNQPTAPTRLVAIWPLGHEGSVGEYAALAHAAIDEILDAGFTQHVVGGTGLYLRAAVGAIGLPPAPLPGARERWEAFYDAEGSGRAHAELAGRDPAAAAVVHANDRRRVVRALELADAGHSLVPARSRLWSEETRHPTLVAGLAPSRAVLDGTIEERTRAMFAAGVEEEVRQVLEQPLSATARKVLGLREIAELAPEDAFEAVVRRTRRYAAYQRKWMRRIPGLVSVAADRPPDEIADEILEMARARQFLPARRAG